MNTRRGFVGLIGALAASAVLDPERLLWVPGKKLISIPRPAAYSFLYRFEVKQLEDLASWSDVSLVLYHRCGEMVIDKHIVRHWPKVLMNEGLDGLEVAASSPARLVVDYCKFLVDVSGAA